MSKWGKLCNFLVELVFEKDERELVRRVWGERWDNMMKDSMILYNEED